MALAVLDIGLIVQQLERYKTVQSFHLPMELSEINGVPKDPWGRDYRYMNFASGKGSDQKARKDHNLHPLNSAFDLYSVGQMEIRARH